jgi:hypothetical protein
LINRSGNPPNRHKTYFALLTVPKDVQYILGKKRFFKTTGTSDLRIAQAKADIFVIQWKAEIANARQKADDPIINSALELNKMLNSSPRELVLDVIHEETDRLRIDTLSRALNLVPTINATAGLHDYIFNANLLEQTTFNNI